MLIRDGEKVAIGERCGSLYKMRLANIESITSAAVRKEGHMWWHPRMVSRSSGSVGRTDFSSKFVVRRRR